MLYKFGCKARGYPFDLQKLEDHTLISIEPIFRGIVSDLERGVGIELSSSNFMPIFSDKDEVSK